MEALSEREREALRMVSIGAMRIRSICRALPPSAVRDKVLDIADGMHNIPMVLAGGSAERVDGTELVNRDLVELKAAIDRATSPSHSGPKEPSDAILQPISGSDAGAVKDCGRLSRPGSNSGHLLPVQSLFPMLAAILVLIVVVLIVPRGARTLQTLQWYADHRAVARVVDADCERRAKAGEQPSSDERDDCERARNALLQVM